MSKEYHSAFDEHREALEELAVSTILELMGDGTVDPKIRKECADSVLKAVGKDAPPKVAANTGPQITFNFGTGLKSALGGLDTFQALLAKPVDGSTEVLE